MARSCAHIAWIAAAIVGVSPALSETALQRGDYLVNGILACGNCHTLKGPGGLPVNERLHAGGSQEWDTPAYKVRGSNITSDVETGIGAWSDDEIKHALTEGVRPNSAKLPGTPIAPIMPIAFYKILTAEDLDATVAYLKSVPPVRSEVQPPVYKAAMEIQTIPGAEKPFRRDDLQDPIKRGFYLVTIGHCMECHTPTRNGRRDFEGSLGQGGREFPGPWGGSVAPNITSHPAKGIGAWSDSEIKQAITRGVSRDGRRLKPPMAYQWYARINEQDLGAIVAYLRTIPPRE
jgi:mono/diheme cytochrome c family protein